MHMLYVKTIHTEGSIAEFGVKYGQNITLFQKFRSIYEPYNWKKKCLAFDTFEGLLGVNEEFDRHCLDGDFSTFSDYDLFLEQVMCNNEMLAPLSHIKKFEIIKGDASYTVKKYIKDNPHALFSLLYFDMDIYKPTKDVLEVLLPRMTKGSIIAFDELNDPKYPGETLAFFETFNLKETRIQKNSTLDVNLCWIEI